MSDRPYGPAQGVWVLAIMVSAVGFGLVPLFARWLSQSGLDPAAIAFWRYFLTALVTLPFISLKQFGVTFLGMIAGAAMGLGWIGYVMAVERTSVANAGVLYMTYPFFTLVFAWILLGHRPGSRGMLAAVMVVAAAWITLIDDEVIVLEWRGILVALAAPLSFGFAITILAGWLHRLPPLSRLACVPLGACLALMPVLATRSQAAVLPVTDDLPLILGIAIATSLVPSLLFVMAAPRIGAVRTAIAGSFELPTMLVLGWLVLEEQIAERNVASAILVIVAILVVSVSRQPKGRPPSA